MLQRALAGSPAHPMLLYGKATAALLSPAPAVDGPAITELAAAGNHPSLALAWLVERAGVAVGETVILLTSPLHPC